MDVIGIGPGGRTLPIPFRARRLRIGAVPPQGCVRIRTLPVPEAPAS